MSSHGKAQKEQGNAYFAQGEYAKAVGAYSAAIAKENTNATYYINRALAYLKLSKFEDAERDATSCLAIDPQNTKALFRRGIARKWLIKYDEAIHDLEAASVAEKENPAIAQEIEQIKNLQEAHAQEQRVKQKRRELLARSGTRRTSDAAQDRLKAAIVSESDSDLLKPISTRSLTPGRQPNHPPKPKPESFVSAKQARDARISASQRQSAKSNHPIKHTSPLPATHCVTETGPIVNAYEFSTAWHNARVNERPLDSMWDILKALDLQRLPAIFQNSLEPEILSDMLRTISSRRDDVLAYELFNALPSIPRFDFIAAFLTDEEKRIANDILASNDAQGSIFAAWGLERAR